MTWDRRWYISKIKCTTYNVVLLVLVANSHKITTIIVWMVIMYVTTIYIYISLYFYIILVGFFYNEVNDSKELCLYFNA